MITKSKIIVLIIGITTLFSACLTETNTELANNKHLLAGHWQSNTINPKSTLAKQVKNNNLMGNKDVVINSIPVSIANDVLYHHISIEIKNKKIYSDTINLFTDNKSTLPSVRTIANNQYEILLGMTQGYTHSMILRLIANKNRVLHLDTLPIFDGTYKNLDNDIAPEFGGFITPFKEYCQDCELSYYNPMLIYELNDKGLLFDEDATYSWIMKHYGVFHGFKAQPNLIVPLQHKWQINKRKIIDT